MFSRLIVRFRSNPFDFSENIFWQSNSFLVTVCFLLLCIYLSVSVARRCCCCLAGDGCWRCQPLLSGAAAAVWRRRCWRGLLSLCAVWSNSGTLSSNRFRQSHTPGRNYFRWTYLHLCFRMGVWFSKGVCATVDHSDKSAVTSTQNMVHCKSDFLSMLIFIFLSLILSSASHAPDLFFFTQPPSILLATLFPSHLANLIPVSFSLVISSALLPLSRPSWGAQCDGDGRVVVRCVCLCDVTPQWLYSCTLFFFPL